MIKLDDNLLTELGLQSLPTEDKKALLRHIYEVLEMRVGTTLARQMTDAQLDEFESFIKQDDEAGALKWLETNFPNYKDVVAQEFEALKAEVRQSAPQILAGAAAEPAPMNPVEAEVVPMQSPIAQPQYGAPQPLVPGQGQPYTVPTQSPTVSQPGYVTPNNPAPQQYQQPVAPDFQQAPMSAPQSPASTQGYAVAQQPYLQPVQAPVAAYPQQPQVGQSAMSGGIPQQPVQSPAVQQPASELNPTQTGSGYLATPQQPTQTPQAPYDPTLYSQGL